MELLTIRNPKTIKGEKRGYVTAILHLAPATISGHNVCPFSTEGCRTSCLNKAGRGGIPVPRGLNRIQKARIKRTRYFFSCRENFLSILRKEIATHVKRCARLDMIPCVRLNGTSDLPFELWDVMQRFPNVRFYDYTKSTNRMLSFLDGQMPKNYYLCFSRTEENYIACYQALARDGNVAVVFNTWRGRPLPQTYYGRRVIDGDLSDLRFLDPKGVVVGLRFKHLMRDESEHRGFIVKE